MRDIEFAHQALWPELDVQYASVTDQWAQMAIAGPRSRDVLVRRSSISTFPTTHSGSWPRARSRCWGQFPPCCSASRSPASWPMSWRCRRGYGEAVANAIMHAGEPYGIGPYGLEALSCHAHREGLCHPQRDQWPGDGRRCRHGAACCRRRRTISGA